MDKKILNLPKSTLLEIMDKFLPEEGRIEIINKYNKHQENFNIFLYKIEEKNLDTLKDTEYYQNFYNEVTDDNIHINTLLEDINYTCRNILSGSSGIVNIYHKLDKYIEFDDCKKYFTKKLPNTKEINTGSGELGFVLFIPDTKCKIEKTHGDFLYWNDNINNYSLLEIKGNNGRIGLYNCCKFDSIMDGFKEKNPFLNDKIIIKREINEKGKLTASPVVRYIDKENNINLKLSDREDFLKWVKIIREHSLNEVEFIHNFYYTYFKQFYLTKNGNIQKDVYEAFTKFILSKNIFDSSLNINKEAFWKTWQTMYIFLVLWGGNDSEKNNTFALLNQDTGYCFYIHKDSKTPLYLLEEIYLYREFISIVSIPSMDDRSEVPQMKLLTRPIKKYLKKHKDIDPDLIQFKVESIEDL